MEISAELDFTLKIVFSFLFVLGCILLGILEGGSHR